MIQVRKGVFETNSSSTHSITMCSKNDYDAFTEGKLLLYGDKLISLEDLMKEDISEECKKLLELLKNETPVIDNDDDEDVEDSEYSNYIEELKYNYEIFTYDSYIEMIRERYEDFYDSFISEKGDEVVAFGYYGNEC